MAPVVRLEVSLKIGKVCASRFGVDISAAAFLVGSNDWSGGLKWKTWNATSVAARAPNL